MGSRQIAEAQLFHPNVHLVVVVVVGPPPVVALRSRVRSSSPPSVVAVNVHPERTLGFSFASCTLSFISTCPSFD